MSDIKPLKHFLSLKYFSAEKILDFIELCKKVKANPENYHHTLDGKCVGLIFEKPSLRTKTSFYVGTQQLGADAIYYGSDEIKLGLREKTSDVARTLSAYLDAIVLRTFSHDNMRELAKFAAIPVINGLSDLLHPSQVLADLLTIIELKQQIKPLKIAYFGDGNNVCNSLLYALAILGGNLTVATPKGYAPQADIVTEAKNFASLSGAKITLTNLAKDAAVDADVLYTDVWTSMGKEKESKLRRKIFKNFQINETIMSYAKKDAIVMHCLPAHRGEEISAAVMDSNQSVVFLQAENRLYSAKAILLYSLGGFL
jgi:ornithine carbamoyltransferase